MKRNTSKAAFEVFKFFLFCFGESILCCAFTHFISISSSGALFLAKRSTSSQVVDLFTTKGISIVDFIETAFEVLISFDDAPISISYSPDGAYQSWIVSL